MTIIASVYRRRFWTARTPPIMLTCLIHMFFSCTAKPPDLPPILGLTKKRRYFEIAVLDVIYNLKNPYLGLENEPLYWVGAALGGGTTEPTQVLPVTITLVK